MPKVKADTSELLVSYSGILNGSPKASHQALENNIKCGRESLRCSIPCTMGMLQAYQSNLLRDLGEKGETDFDAGPQTQPSGPRNKQPGLSADQWQH
ncbi:hypothetical protein Baya_1046 [Bagarius yarrelli]|uniref:Uncharacterized protein n=1 Tax=Bagarius yarrelli TaxID=175774 RepID=A0A556TJZ6_BAGYA|nr:hypothetical protein Baya_1046 [Bagarius yarrelli]